MTPHFDADTALELAHGLLPAEAARHALEHARACPSCDELLRLAAGDRERFRARAAEILAERRSTGRRSFATAAAAAAVLMVAAVAGLLFLRAPTPASRAGVLRLPVPREIVELRAPGENEARARLEEALAAQERGDDALAAALLERPFDSLRFEPMRRLYRANALLALGRDDAASALLDTLAAARLPGPEADWHAWARAHVGGETAREDSIVRALAARPHPLQAEAKAWLERRDAAR